MNDFPKHTIKRASMANIWDLLDESGELVAAFSTSGMDGYTGSIFLFDPSKGWKMSQVDKAFRQHIKKEQK